MTSKKLRDAAYGVDDPRPVMLEAANQVEKLEAALAELQDQNERLMAGRECAGCGGWVTMHEDQATWKELTDKLAEYERQINDYKKIIHENAASVFGQENKRLNGEVVELRNRLAECEQRNMAYEI